MQFFSQKKFFEFSETKESAEIVCEVFQGYMLKTFFTVFFICNQILFLLQNLPFQAFHVSKAIYERKMITCIESLCPKMAFLADTSAKNAIFLRAPF